METGTVIRGFRVERTLGAGSLGTVYEATQLSLGRPVALRLIEESRFSNGEALERFSDQQRLAASLHHPSIVPTYEAGEWEGGRFVATRFVRGRTLADLLEHGEPSPDRIRALLQPIGAALDAAHAAGLIHGRVTARNVLVDFAGSAQLADLGLGRPGTAAADLKDFEALVPEAAPTVHRSERRTLVTRGLGFLAVLGVVAAAITLLAGEGEGGASESAPAPTVAGSAVPIGSDLAPGPAAGIGCSDDPGPNTPACTLTQLTLGGRSARVPESGVVRSWAVRGAEGDLALQVVGHRGGRVFLRGFSRVEHVPDAGPHAFPSNLQVKRGDSIAVLLSPGAAIGSREGPSGASALRWEGALDYSAHSAAAAPVEGELMLRADVEPGASPDLPQITGARAARLPAGATVAEQAVDLAASGLVRVVLVRVGGGVAIDTFRGGTRLARIAVPDADPDGRVLGLESSCGFERGFCLRWQNEGDAEPIIHAYRLAMGGTAFKQIG